MKGVLQSKNKTTSAFSIGKSENKREQKLSISFEIKKYAFNFQFNIHFYKNIT